jgi:hypothetical protein
VALPCLVVPVLAAPGSGAQTPDPTTPNEPPSTTVPGSDPTVPPSTTVPPPPGTEPAPSTTLPETAPTSPPPGSPSSPPVEQEAEYRPDEELAAARLLLQQQMGQAGNLQQVIQTLRAEIEAELAELDAQLSTAEASAGAAEQAALDADVALEGAEVKVVDAEATAERSEESARESIVDAFMSPMSMPVRALEDQNEATYAKGLIASRADHRLEMAQAAARADQVAQRARADAVRAAEQADEASADAAEAAMAVSDARTARLWELEDLATFTLALAEQTQVLGQFDGVLEQQELVRMIEARIAASRPVEKAATVRIPGTTIDVHHLIAERVSAMIDAARAEGVVLDGWGWRSHQRQIELRIDHCGPDPYSVYEAPASSCSPPTARPGNSMHERGVAIDFKECDVRSTVCYRWLAEHAHLYGLYNLPSEPWHWSTNGR